MSIAHRTTQDKTKMNKTSLSAALLGLVDWLAVITLHSAHSLNKYPFVQHDHLSSFPSPESHVFSFTHVPLGLFPFVCSFFFLYWFGFGKSFALSRNSFYVQFTKLRRTDRHKNTESNTFTSLLGYVNPRLIHDHNHSRKKNQSLQVIHSFYTFDRQSLVTL